jgi:serralysin
MRLHKWKSQDRITISFLNGEPALHQRVKAVAETWTSRGMANLGLSFQKTNDSMIRISFDQPGSWSVIGTTCLAVKNLAEPTMNLGTLKPDSPQDVLERSVLHEFGHALGLIHEHQNPENTIPWDRQRVIADLTAGKNPWTRQQIEENMFAAYNKTEMNSTKFDPLSIMLYPIPKNWTQNNYSVGLNTKLSDTDKKFIRMQYS